MLSLMCKIGKEMAGRCRAEGTIMRDFRFESPMFVH